MKNKKKGLPSGVLALIILIGAYLFMRLIMGLPSNLTNFYMLFFIAGVIIYITLEDDRINEFLNFISLRSQEPPAWDYVRKGILIVIPFLVAFNVYSSQKVTYAPIAELFSPHVTPPQWVVDLKVPEWAAKAENWDTKRIEAGKKIYEDNCLPCHGENADGLGPMSKAIRYPAKPTNFKEPGTIAQLPITYIYWRVRDGGIFDKQFKSAMPGWGDELTDDEMWEVIMYAYTKAGVKPRTWE
jgi:mono/diheme cytochrome c family protein